MKEVGILKTKAQKAEQLKEIKAQLDGAKAILLVDFNGLTVSQDTDLRRKMRAAGVVYTVHKNTLIGIAAKECGIEGLDQFLSHNTALAISKDDVVAPAKIAVEFAKKNEALKIKAGLLNNKLMSQDEIKALAALPSKEVLLAKMLSSMNAPISGLVNVLQGTIRNAVYVLEAIRKQKEATEKKSA
jgi:large subunit ribosomal protein L10